MKWCPECNSIFNNSINIEDHCPMYSCEGKVIWIDDLIFPTIELLNEKGYITKSCCSGHLIPDEHFSPYIMFEDYDGKELVFEDLFKILPKSLFDFEIYKTIYNDEDIYNDVIRYIGHSEDEIGYDVLSVENRLIHSSKACLELYKWASELPFRYSLTKILFNENTED